MSEFFAKLLTRDENGNLNCKFCPRKFVTTTGYEVHLKTNHEPETLTQEEPKIKKEPTDDNKEINNKTETKKQKSTNQGGEVNLNEFLECKKSLLHLNEPIRTDDKKLTANNSKKYVSIATRVNLVNANLINRYDGSLAPQKCPECQKSVMYMKKHINTVHKKLRPHKCIQCEKTFAQISNLQVHIKLVHKKLKLYKCQKCKYACGQKADIEKHEHFVHLKLGKQQCKECKKSFRDLKYLEVHISVQHRQIRPHKCDKCSHSFGLNGGLQNHIKRIHNKANLDLPSEIEPKIKFPLKQENNDF